jgi:CubicO group peptidase (beta-lactamase class C family)
MEGFMRKYFFFVTAIVIIIGISFVYFGADNYNSENYIEKLIQKYSPQGASVIILDDYKIKEVKNFGYANVESKIPVNIDTQFKIASISKSVTAYGIMQLVDNGVLNLDEPISTYLTRWQLPDTEYDESKVTIRTLLSHTSGVSGSDEYGYSIPLPDVATVLKERGIHLKREPATTFEYSEFTG